MLVLRFDLTEISDNMNIVVFNKKQLYLLNSRMRHSRQPLSTLWDIVGVLPQTLFQKIRQMQLLFFDGIFFLWCQEVASMPYVRHPVLMTVLSILVLYGIRISVGCERVHDCF